MKKQSKKANNVKSQNPSGNKTASLSLVKNILLVLISLFILRLLYNVVGYKSLYDNIIDGNLKIIERVKKAYPQLSYDQKLEIKWGINGNFINKIKQVTPEDAVILIPPDSVYSREKKEGDLSVEWRYKGWILYHLYPRKIVKESEKNVDPNYKNVNYVCIINHWGYDKLNYPVQNKERYTILPVNKQ